MTFGLMVKQM